jgi:hypothetical protein
MTVLVGAPDPYILLEFNGPANFGNYNLSGKTPVTLNPAQNNGILVTFGDSLGGNIVTSAFTPVNSNVLNFCIQNGGTYNAVDPVLGCSNGGSPLGPGNMFTRLADSVQGTGKFTKTVLVPTNVGGTIISQWEADSFLRIRTAFARLAAAGVTATAVLIQIGANDKAAGTLQAAYTASQALMIAQIRLYYAGPIFIATETWFAGAVSAGIVAAQAAPVSAPAKIIAGPNTDSLNAANRQADNTHWNDAGAAACAALWLTALQAYGPPFT